MADKREGPYYTHSEALAAAKGRTAEVVYDRHWWVVPTGKKGKAAEAAPSVAPEATGDEE